MSQADVLDTPSSTRTYGISALLSGLGTMWRGTAPALVAIVLNAVVQSLLVYWNAPIGLNIAFIVSFLLSAVVLVYSFAVLARTALSSVDGRVSLGQAMAQVRATLGGFAVWAVLLIVAVTLALLISPIAAWVLLVLVPFVPLAAADGKGNALGANFHTIRKHFGRWLITALIVTLIGAVLFLLTSVNVLFVKGFPASLIGWLGIGLLAWWLLTAWALVYRKDANASQSMTSTQDDTPAA